MHWLMDFNALSYTVSLQAFSEDSFRAEVLIFLMADLGNGQMIEGDVHS